MTLKTVDDVLRTSNSRGIDPRAVIFDSCPGAFVTMQKAR